MAKIEGTQSIPAEWLDEYRANLTDAMPNGVVRRRYPYRLRKFQKYGYGVTDKQKKQRERFLGAIEKFNETTPAERAAWYESMPPWSSLLWYFNWFLMSGISGVLGAIVEGIQVIRNIQHEQIDLPVTGATITFDSAVNPAKVVMLFQGAGYKMGIHTYGTVEEPFIIQCMPYYHSLFSSSVDVRFSIEPDEAADISLTIIEYI